MVLECAPSDLMLLEQYDVGLTMGILRSFGLVVELVDEFLSKSSCICTVDVSLGEFYISQYTGYSPGYAFA